ncbi:fumarylacetoacetate hydrolase family protein [Thermodesulforhabdus norvegica]|uniref:2-keto-4-pentenoate hydratase/2-oxohepta-3-ene-1,7-dioic acid hydratase (Catechol pathway) n=1 Tax=Thermodesulforhabdus norvegica TaxID=39841 RepID=A0A1I4TPC7_9BACT|nr:fumarylacetoacetate hydrolase family protein [Thermodesulforhabdus norvegica]SFM78397.1 2-keto-4-pentenoate hydratase/2-oxohepta-3-ene-1,7-dioic acid hydratase (catechol pathway) [Thermodesulforhabdus norvegica]
MRIAAIKRQDAEVAAILTDFGFLPLPSVNDRFGKEWPVDILGILTEGKLDEIKSWFSESEISSSEKVKDLCVPLESVRFAPLYRRPRKIWGIGLNYKAHAEDLSERVPTQEPASFMKPDTTIIGYGDEIRIPTMSEKTTGEAELVLVFGKKCKNVEASEWLTVLAGFTSAIDMTAEDILRRNPRNLTQSKSFDTFLSLGPILYTADEVDDVYSLKIQTVINGKVHAEDVVSNMTFPPDFLVSYHSRIMTMLPGDIILTGTPGAVPLKEGDVIECRITGFHPLVNPVVDLKLRRNR